MTLETALRTMLYGITKLNVSSTGHWDVKVVPSESLTIMNVGICITNELDEHGGGEDTGTFDGVHNSGAYWEANVQKHSTKTPRKVAKPAKTQTSGLHAFLEEVQVSRIFAPHHIISCIGGHSKSNRLLPPIERQTTWLRVAVVHRCVQQPQRHGRFRYLCSYV